MSETPFPSPPWPTAEDPRLILLMDHLATNSVDLVGKRITADLLDQILFFAVVHGWYEGYIAAAGESARPGGPVPTALVRRLLYAPRRGRGS